MATYNLPIAERINKLFTVNSDGCWIWSNKCNKQGYGNIRVGGRGGVEKKAHRVSWEVFRGEIPKGKFVLHSCDVTSCINPDHLFIGDQTANMQDMIKKGRDNSPFGVNRNKTHCKRGHEFTIENTVVVKTGRACKECRRVTALLFNRKKFGYSPRLSKDV